MLATVISPPLIIDQQKWIDMMDLREFLLSAKGADLETRLPDDITGPVSSPLYRYESRRIGAYEKASTKTRPAEATGFYT
jgi:hypothetical protein